MAQLSILTTTALVLLLLDPVLVDQLVELMFSHAVMHLHLYMTSRGSESEARVWERKVTMISIRIKVALLDKWLCLNIQGI